jgi:hypothetical protein
MQRNRQPSDNVGNVVRFRRTQPPATGGIETPLVEDIAKYERTSEEPDDWRHRQLTNLAAFAVCLLLVIAGIWIAIRMAELQRDQECVLAGRRNCAAVSIDGNAAR